MIDQQQRDYSWHFPFLGADQDAFAEAHAMGIGAEGAANYARGNEIAAFDGTMSKVARMRRQAREGKTVDNAFTAEEREQMG